MDFLVTSQENVIKKFIDNYSKSIKVPYVIGIAGGSGSGKTYVTEIIKQTVNQLCYHDKPDDLIVVISQDFYYRNGNSETNYDIPSSIEFDLMVSGIKKLISGNPMKCPMYDFVTHTRKSETMHMKPAKIIIIEGILIFTQEELRNLCTLKVFVGAEEATQIFRRIDRDTKERGRTLEEIKKRYHDHVGPSFKEYVLPSARYADLTINNHDDCYTGLEILMNQIVRILQNLR